MQSLPLVKYTNEAPSSLNTYLMVNAIFSLSKCAHYITHYIFLPFPPKCVQRKDEEYFFFSYFPK